jgi:hypothetical protein
MEEQLQVTAKGSAVRCNTVQRHHEAEKCLVMRDSVMRNVGTECRNMVVKCFQGIRTDQVHRVVKNRDLKNPTPIKRKKYSRHIYNN